MIRAPRYRSLALLALLCVSLSGCLHGPFAGREPIPQDPKGLVALVNALPVRQEELTAKMEELRALAPPTISEQKLDLMTPRIQREALDALIDERLVDDAIERRGIRPSHAQVEAELAATRMYLTSVGDSLEAYMRRNKLTPATLRRRIARQIAANQLWDGMLALQPPTEAEAREFYHRNLPRYSYPAAVRMSQIVIPFPAGRVPTQEDRHAALVQAERLRQRLLAGVPFDQLMREQAARSAQPPLLERIPFIPSLLAAGGAALPGADARKPDAAAAPALATATGELGWVTADAPLPTEVLDVALRLPPGEVNPIVRSAFGYHLLKIIEQRRARVAPFEEVQAIVEDDVMTQRRNAGRPAQLAKLRAEADIREFVK